MKKAFRSFLIITLGLLLYIPGATATCVLIVAWPNSLSMGTLFLILPVAYLAGSSLLSLASSPSINRGHFLAFLVVPIAGALSYALLLSFIPNDKAAVTIGAPVAGVIMFIAAKLTLRLANSLVAASAVDVKH